MTDTSQQKVADMADISKIISRAQESFKYEIFVPSLGRNVMFKEITTAQQKRIIKSIIDSQAFNTEFIFTFREVIKENCAEDININALTIYDKLIIAIYMRAMSIGNEIEITLTSKTNKKYVKQIILTDLVKSALANVKIDNTDKSFADERGIFTVVCSLPTIDEEFRLENELRKNVADLDVQNYTQLRTTVGDIYINEIAKYVKKILIKNDTEVMEIDLNTVNFKNRITLIEKLPAKLIQDVIKYMTSINNEVQKVILVSEDVEGEKYEERLRINGSFFTIS